MTKLYPLMPLRDIVIFPHMVAPLVVGRKNSIQALEDAMEKKTDILLVTQKKSSVDVPESDDLYSFGTLATVMQLLRLPDGTIKALVEGKKRAKIVSFVPHDKFLQAEIEECSDEVEKNVKLVAYERELKKFFGDFAAENKKIAKEVVKSIESIDNPQKLLNIVCSHLPLKSEEKQQILEIDPLTARIEKVLEVLNREIELGEIEKSINAKVKMRMGKTQRDYYLGEKVREIQTEIGQNEDGLDEMGELEETIKAKKMPDAAREKTFKEFKKLKSMPPMSAETTVVRNYIDCIVNLPWDEKSRSKIDIQKAEKILEADHYGLSKTKERILEYLAVQAQVKKIKGPILCLVGPPGVGKTSICRSIARAMGRKFARLSLGGVRDEAEIRGHRRTYIGAMPGKIIQAMQKVGKSNPVFCLDEVDKMSMDFRGDPSSALLEVLDPEQNVAFNDHYLDIDYDLSEVFFITTANSLHGIPVPLQDRMEIIQISGYTEEDKLKIAEGYLIPKQLKENGFKQGDINLTDGAVLEIVRRYTREAGVRNLERIIASLCRKVARDRLKRKRSSKKYRVNVQSVLKYLGTPKYRYGLAEEHDEIGLATGLAWTEVGGELLQIEATLMTGSGKLIITGKLGDVMQESAQAALSYVRTRAEALGLEEQFYQKLDIHVHVPEGAIPKDGPSAGITIATTLVSALTRIPVKHYLAMTGEITLRGRVLPIGGLTEKLLAAKRGNITHVLIPKENERDLNDVPVRIRKSLTIDVVEHMDEVLDRALALKKGKSIFRNRERGQVAKGDKAAKKQLHALGTE
ncbi:ATP-dependent proteinase. Serine peptidase. MEROPS family S16 [Desulforhopalus singaporensis]|uniref:Lon protease n=2 Tax=Desulforhopalus singaporensis TaxID=91360 RepID=A0A1H0PYV9_9BACT|nr:endopeptidase La [Desulforhopalus singaporensis]SDP10367.1 ATP-dependent proteinase. Serine peptidase. MEROPS family S16 [Desulforhopalus singaporensis]